MPRALIILDWDKIKGPVIRAKYPEINIDPDLPMKIFMAHTSAEPAEIQVSLQFGSANVASRFTQFKQKGTLRRLLFILLLNLEENPKDFFKVLEAFENSLTSEIDAAYLSELVKNVYIEQTAAQISMAINPEELSDKIIARSKQLLDQGEIQKAQLLISKSKAIPPRIIAELKLAEAAVSDKKFVEAGEHYEIISKLLLDVDETTMMQEYHDKAEKLKKIPNLQKEIKEFVESANKALKKVDFSEAIEWFKAAAKKSEELEDKVKTGEYSKKAEALMAFLEAEREAKLKKSSNNS